MNSKRFARAGRLFAHSIYYVFLTFMAVVVWVPLAWVIGSAFRPNSEIGLFSGLTLHAFLPQRATAENFAHIFSQLDMWRIIGNTVFVAAAVTAGSLLINSLTAYAFAKINFSFKNAIFMIVLSMLVLPIEILIIPLYLTVNDMRMLDSFAALIIPFLAAPFGIFFMRQFFSNVPDALDDAAVLDGCGHFLVFSRIYMPISRTPLITLGLLTFMQQWDSFIVPVTFMFDEKKMLLQVAFTRLAIGLYANDYGVMFAGVVVAIVPIIALFLAFQKNIVESVASAGIKG
jgi:multiple sugar transport system permease protein